MKVMVLAGGKSTRLGALGARTPKPMLPLRGRPVLAWTLERLRASGLTDVVINLHHAPEVIPDYFGDGAAFGVRISYSYEPEIQGTAGAMRHARSALGRGPVLVVYGDNVLDWDPLPMIREHEARGPIATIAVAQIPDPSRSGVVRFDAHGEISTFYEKPGYRPELGNWVNAAVYVVESTIFDFIPEAGMCDFGYDVFPQVLQKGLCLRAYPLERPPAAIDTPEQYAAVLQSWAH